MQTVDSTGAQDQAIRRLATAALALLTPIEEARPFLAAWPAIEVARAIPPATLPVLRWLDDAAMSGTPATTTLVRMLAAVAAGLSWRQSYAAADFGSTFLDRYGWSELVGPTGPIAADATSCGFLLLGPDVHYPSHAHEAEELYLPLAGAALWQRGDTAPARQAPGTAIHHPAWLPHAMWTEAEPLVALYCWRGGTLGAKPQIVGRA